VKNTEFRVCISVKKITHFRIIYNEVLLTRQTPRGNAIWCILCAAENNRTSPKTHRCNHRRCPKSNSFLQGVV